MNRFKIILWKEKEFEDVWKNRDTHLKNVPGFKEFHLVKGYTNDEHTLYATYTMGSMTVGVQTSEKDVSGGATSDTESTGFGLSYVVSDDLSVSVGSHEIEFNSGDDQEAFGVSASYTMGSLTIGAAMNSVDNIANTATNDRSAYELGLTFAF